MAGPQMPAELPVGTTRGGLSGLAGRLGTRSLPMVVHPLVWTRRRLILTGDTIDELPTLSKRSLTNEGFKVIERRQPSLLLDGSILITGEVDRTIEFERGNAPAPPAVVWFVLGAGSARTR